MGGGRRGREVYGGLGLGVGEGRWGGALTQENPYCFFL